MIFAAKTTAAGLVALLIAFRFNLDQPQWALLTVFIVSQPQQSGVVLAKSFFRIIGTLVGAAVALLFVALFAQQRVLFLGALALWIGTCTFGSQYARNFVAYSCVLSGYTTAIVGIPGALAAHGAFYVATARVTEVCLGIVVAAAINRIVLPSSAAAALWQSVAATRQTLADYVAELLGGGDAAKSPARLVSSAIALESQRVAAEFEDREIRERIGSLRLLNIALLRVAGATQWVGEQLAYFRRTGSPVGGSIGDALAGALSALRSWGSGAIHAAGLRQELCETDARRQLGELLFPMQSSGNAARRRTSMISGLRELFAALAAYAEAYDACLTGSVLVPGSLPFRAANDAMAALWAGLRAALAVILVGWFWILTAWPEGSTAVILAAVATARVATMGRAVPLALAAIMVFSLATVPVFVIVDVLVPLASGFPMFALTVGPMLFGCAFLMSKPNPKAALVGYLSALLFASVGQFEDRMVYDPVGLLNTSIAAVFAVGATLVMWAVIAPATPEAARRRFLRVARRAVNRLAAAAGVIGFAEYETRLAEALHQLQSDLRANNPDDLADLAASTRLLGAAHALLRQWEQDDAALPVVAASARTSNGYVAAIMEIEQSKELAELSSEGTRYAT
jgi:uncharacterized membrane protein YccC